MFSPAIHDGGPAMATRSRRRQRPASSDNSIQQPKAKRQRLPLTESTFVNPDVTPEMYEIKSDRVAMLRTGIENASTPVANKELSVRSKKPKPGERISKGDGSVVLVRPDRENPPNGPMQRQCADLDVTDEQQRVHREQASRFAG